MKVISLKKAAEIANISLSTLKRLIASGKLRKVRPSEGRVGVFQDELAELLESSIDGDAE